MSDYTTFLTTEDFSGYEDPERYQREWLPKVEAYRKALSDAVTPEYAVTVPKDIDTLVKEQFNAVDYLYKNKLLSEEEFAITDSSATALAAKLATGELSAVQVFKAFAKRAVICHQFLNCAMELFTDEGLERAKYLDEYYAKSGKPIGPLHGIPISLKEQMAYRGKITHGGYVSMVDNITPEHGITTQILEDLGAVFYIRTTQPQTLMHLDSNNNFTGLTRNPYNMKLSSGGSSSGEGAVVAFGGSAIGIGSDIGGSIRAPSAYSGGVGLRPSTKRFALYGGVSGGAGQESVPAVSGPMTRSVEDVDFLMEHYLNEGKPWVRDAYCLRMPWRKVEKPEAKDITIGVMWDDGLVHPTPPITRGLKFVVDKLKAAGVKVVDFAPIRTQEAYDTVHKMYNCDGNYKQRLLLAGSGEPLCKLTKWSLNYGDGSKEYTVKENRVLNLLRDQLRFDYNKFMVDNGIDFILTPTYSNVAPVSEEVYGWSYTSLFNILDFPTLVFQTGLFQDPAVDKWDESFKDYKFRSELEKLELEQYVPETFAGAPIGLQLAGKRYEDEEVVAAGKTIVDIIGADLFKH